MAEPVPTGAAATTDATSLPKANGPFPRLTPRGKRPLDPVTWLVEPPRAPGGAHLGQSRSTVSLAARLKRAEPVTGQPKRACRGPEDPLATHGTSRHPKVASTTSVNAQCNKGSAEACRSCASFTHGSVGRTSLRHA